MSPVDPFPRVPRRFLARVLLALLVVLDLAALYLAIPAITADLDLGAADPLRTADIFDF